MCSISTERLDESFLCGVIFRPTYTASISAPIQNEAKSKAEDNKGRGKCARIPSQCIKDLLEERGTWTDEPTNSLVPPGIQLMAEGGADDDELTNWLVVPDYVEGYAFAVITGDSEALEP